MKYLVSVSGGIASGVSWIIAHEQGLNYEPIFCDTLWEDEDLYRFNFDIERALNTKLTVLTEGRDPFKVFEDVKFIGNSRTAACSRILKTEPFAEYIRTKYKDEELTIIMGFGLSERERLGRASYRWSEIGKKIRGKPILVSSLLNVKEFYTRQSWINKLKEYNIKEPRLYDLGFAHNNCGGRCPRAGVGHFKNLLEKLPERYEEISNRYKEAKEKIGPTARPFLKSSGEYITLDELKTRIIKPEEMFDMGGCGCFTED